MECHWPARSPKSVIVSCRQHDVDGHTQEGGAKDGSRTWEQLTAMPNLHVSAEEHSGCMAIVGLYGEDRRSDLLGVVVLATAKCQEYLGNKWTSTQT